MRKFFAGLLSPPELDELAEDIDSLVAKYSNGIARKRTALHATVVAPQRGDHTVCIRAHGCVASAALSMAPAMALGKPYDVVSCAGTDYLGIPLEGYGVEKAFSALADAFCSCFGGTQKMAKGWRPHITLLSSQNLPAGVFDAVWEELKSRPQPAYIHNPVVLSTLALFERGMGDAAYSVTYKAALASKQCAA